MKELPSPEQALTVGGLPSEDRREVIGGQVHLPGRYPIITDGVQRDLTPGGNLKNVCISQDQMDAELRDEVTAMVNRIVKEARRQLKMQGRNLDDWKATVTIAVHHKGQATEFWFGDAPDRKKVDKSLPENLTVKDYGRSITVEIKGR